MNAHVEQLTPAPWDNELARDARVQDLREAIVREHLHSVGNKLRDDPDAIAVFRKMNIIAPATGQELPRNVGLLFFSSEPERWFPGARIVVTKFLVDRTGTETDEHTYCGSVTTQLHECLRHLEGLSLTHIKKEIDQIQASGWVSYPIQALQEALVNAVFHRSYCPEILEPTKVCIYSDRIEIISYPGPVPGVEEEHLIANAAIPSNSAPARNPRVGEFLTQLRFARGIRTGLPRIYKSMAENGSPVPKFDFDCSRQWFRATLFAHPQYVAICALQDAAYLRIMEGKEAEFIHVQNAWEANEGSAALASEMIRLCAERDDLTTAEDVFYRFHKNNLGDSLDSVANKWMKARSRKQWVTALATY